MAIQPAWSAAGGTIDQAGRLTPDRTGVFEVAAAVGVVVGQATVTVVAGKLAKLALDPPSAIITIDETQQFSARGSDSKGNDLPLVPLWSSGGGRIDGNGLFSPDRVGAFEVEASDRGVRGIATVTVVPGVPASIEVVPGSAVTSALRTIRLRATAFDRSGEPLPHETGFAWRIAGPIGRLNASTGPVAELYTDSPLGGNGEIVVALGALEAKVPVTVKPAPYPIDKSTTPSDPSKRGENFLSLYPSFVCFWAVAVVGVIALLLGLRWVRRKRRGRASRDFARVPRTGPVPAHQLSQWSMDTATPMQGPTVRSGPSTDAPSIPATDGILPPSPREEGGG